MSQTEFPSFQMATLPGIKLPLAVRPAMDDKMLLGTIFANQDYAVPIDDFSPKLIIDCGANVGYSAVYFANKYPDAKIIAVEPERGNYKMLTYNTNFYDNIECIQSALWNVETYIEIQNPDYGGSIGFQTVETTADNPNALKTTTVGKLLAESGFDAIDLLKVDIEGAEREVFGADDVDSWLSKVKVLAVELHDRMKRGCAMTVFGAISKYNFYHDFYLTKNGESLLFVREELMK